VRKAPGQRRIVTFRPILANSLVMTLSLTGPDRSVKDKTEMPLIGTSAE
jgi:hypothetical protein